MLDAVLILFPLFILSRKPHIVKFWGVYFDGLKLIHEG